MKANVHVDYLSHKWTAHDVIRANIQTRKQIRAVMSKLSADPASRVLRLEHQRLVRFQNALWRQMARTCTGQLGRDNPLIDPSSVDWQKESDITWLYGPLYTDDDDDSPPSRATYDRPLGLKPALKKSSTSLYEHRSIDDRIPSFSSIASSATTASSISQPPTPIASISSAAAHNGVRFSPESTIRVQYFIPESPVKESLGVEGWNPYWSPMDDEDEDNEDDDLWEFMVTNAKAIQKAVTNWLWPIPRQRHHRQRQLSSKPMRPTTTTTTTMDLMFTLVSVCKSMASLAATWLMYQGMLRILRKPTSGLSRGQSKRDNAITWQLGPS
ncbi:hypothetical protein BX666DRAFT_1881928 [Dichotomocladium elegans]|nr:hypothetical protein BX666DRAFT_1881928 [Dichotomocladium elegans]